MSYGRARHSPACITGSILISGPLLFLAALFPQYSSAQSADVSPTTPGLRTPTISMSTTGTRASISITGTPQSMSTSYTALSTIDSTTSSTTSTANEDINPQLFPDSQTDPNQVRNDNVFNYYFLFLAAFGVLVAIGLWWIHKRRKQRKEQVRLSGQNALARDLDGWVNTRRWFHGAWRHNQTTAFVRREEGLNERGEAPPPYEPKSEVAHDNAGSTRDAESGLAIPLRTLSRDGIEHARPPEYETVNHDDSSGLMLGTGDTQTARPHTSDLPTNSSTRDLVRDRTTSADS